MPDKIAIMKESGEQLNSNIVSVFLIPETNKKYIITTENTLDPHGLNILHVSEIAGEQLAKIATEQEWQTIKNIMRSIISGNVGPYQYEMPIEQIKATGQYYRDISVSSTASKQMADNYMADVTKKQEEAKAAAKAAKEAEEAAQEVRKNPENEALSSLSEAEPIAPVVEEKVAEPVQKVEEVKKEEKIAEPVKEENIQTVKPSTIFPANDTKVDDNASVTPGIAEVGDDEEDEIEAEDEVVELSTNFDDSDIGPAPVVEAKEEPEVPAAQATVIEPNNAEVGPVETTSVKNDDNVKSDSHDRISIDFTVPSSFSPDATLDEVLVGAQEVFMEGVKNLIQTMSEKLYRDFYEKQKSLKEREELLIQREKLLNDQIALINKQLEK